MFHERLVRWSGILDTAAMAVGSMLHVRTVGGHMKFSVGKGWDSAARKHEFETYQTARKAIDEFQGRLPVAR
jgi:hypothetical protein